MTHDWSPFGDLVCEAISCSTGRKVLFPEGEDERVARAAIRVAELGLASPVVVRDRRIEDPRVVTITRVELGVLAGIQVHDEDSLAKAAAMLVDQGQVDAAVLGALLTSSTVLRSGLRVLGLAPGRSKVTGAAWVEIMAPEPRRMLFVDPVVVVAPDAETLTQASIGAVELWVAATGTEARVAFLSSATGASGADQYAGLMTDAAVAVAAELNVVTEGPIQGDVAVSTAVAAKKAYGAIRGDANVLVFPCLAAANIALKLLEHLGGARVCPVLSGLARPFNDLSRGCRVEDVVAATALTVLQMDGGPRMAQRPE